MDNSRRYAIVAALVVVELFIVSAMVHAVRPGMHRSSAMASTAGAPHLAAQTVQTGAAPHVVIDDDDAAVTVTATAGTLVRVDEQRPRSSGHGPVTVERTADGVRIASHATPGFHINFMGDDRRTLAVAVPSGARVEVLNAGRIEVAGLRERASLHSDNGTIVARDHRGDLIVTASNGRVELHDVAASTINATSDNGRIELDNVRTDALALHASNGRIIAKRTLASSGKIESSNGRIELGFDRGANVTVTAQSSNGRIRASAPLSVAAAGDGDEGPRTITVGNGSGRLDVSSENGSITISSMGA